MNLLSLSSIGNSYPVLVGFLNGSFPLLPKTSSIDFVNISVDSIILLAEKGIKSFGLLLLERGYNFSYSKLYKHSSIWYEIKMREITNLSGILIRLLVGVVLGFLLGNFVSDGSLSSSPVDSPVGIGGQVDSANLPPPYKPPTNWEECFEEEFCFSCCVDKLDECLNDCDKHHEKPNAECQKVSNQCAVACGENQEPGSPEYDRCMFGCVEDLSDCRRPHLDCRSQCGTDMNTICWATCPLN